jgi:acyl-CoA dehydrogenase
MVDSATDNRPQAVVDAIALASSVRKRANVQPAADTRAETNALLQQIQRDRLVWAMAPVERGGFGASLSDTAKITFQLAKASGSLGLMYAMHASQAFTLLRHGAGSPFLESLTDRLIADQALVASGTSEKGVGGNIFGSICMIEGDASSGLSVSKESPNVSYLDHAGAVLVTAMRETPQGAKTQVLIAAETGHLAFEPGPEAEMMGMRGILNRPYSLTARFGPDAIFRDDYPHIASQTMTPFIHVLWAALWSGLAAQALAKASAFSAKSAVAGEGAELTKTELSRLANKHYTMNVLIREAARETGESDTVGSMDLGRTAKIKRLKIVASELLEEICIGSLSVIGFAAYAETGKFSLSEIIRDSLSARVMISNYRLLLANSAIERFVEDTL